MVREDFGVMRCIGRKKNDNKNIYNVVFLIEFKEDLIM